MAEAKNLIETAPTSEDPALEDYTVNAVMGWVNQRSGRDRDIRLARVLSIVNPERRCG